MSQKNYSVSVAGMSVKGHQSAGNTACYGKFPGESDDIYRPKGVLFIIADGTGELIAGNKISRYTIGFISREYFSSVSNIISSSLFWAFKTANLKLLQMNRYLSKLKNKNVSCSALVIKNNLAYIAHTGNTAIFRITDKKIELLTSENIKTVVQVNDDIRSNNEKAGPSEKSKEDRDFNFPPDIEVDILKDIPVSGGDNFVLCTESLKNLNKKDIHRIVLNYEPEIACLKLINLARETGAGNNLAVQIIKVILQNDVKTIRGNRFNKLFTPVKLKSLILLITAAAVLAAVIFNQDKLFQIFLKTPPEVQNLPAERVIKINPDNIRKPDQKANALAESHYPDTTLALNPPAIKNNPELIDEAEIRDSIRKSMIEKGNLLLAAGNNKSSLEYFKRALSLNPADSLIFEKISMIEDKLKKPVQSAGEVKRTNKIAGTDAEVKTPVDSKVNGESKPETTVEKFSPADWIAPGLTENDYKADSEGITFFGSNKVKRIISTGEMKDINIEAKVKFVDSAAGSRAGIIIGYDTSGSSPGKNYLLFTADYKGNFSLLNVSGGREQVLKSVSWPDDLSEDKKYFKIKLKSLGPWVILYLDDRLLGSWYGKDFIKGKIGLYAGANTAVDFTSLKVSSAFEVDK